MSVPNPGAKLPMIIARDVRGISLNFCDHRVASITAVATNNKTTPTQIEKTHDTKTPIIHPKSKKVRKSAGRKINILLILKLRKATGITA